MWLEAELRCSPSHVRGMGRPARSSVLDRFYLVQLKLDGGFAAEHGDHHPDLAAVQVDLLDRAQEGLQSTVGDFDVVAPV